MRAAHVRMAKESTEYREANEIDAVALKKMLVKLCSWLTCSRVQCKNSN